MKQFSQLIAALEMSNRTTSKIEALINYFKVAPEKDKLWVIALFTGKRPARPVKTNVMKELCMEMTGVPEWLFLESYSAVGDLGETLSLLLPEPTKKIDWSLSEWMDRLLQLKSKTDTEKKEFVKEAWSRLDSQERFIFNKIIGGSFRIGVSKKTLVNALAKLTEIDANQLMHSIIGNWAVNTITFDALLHGEHINYDNSKPYPFCLAYPLEDPLESLGDCKDWIVEQKWDGIRGQVIKRNEEIYIWSRGEELVTQQFPEIVEWVSGFQSNFVLDGEILALKDSSVLLFNDLQKRLNRKTITKKLLSDIPVGFFVYDILEYDFNDLRDFPMDKRRELLENLFKIQKGHNHFKLSELISFSKWDQLPAIREESRSINSEGLMLKNSLAPYATGRKKGIWWKWKVDPLTIDAVMIYAQKGSGRRSSKYTDYTFAVKNGEELVTIAKAYSGLTDKEITEISKWVNANAIEKFGPVRTVKPELIFEIAFEGIALSKRHKSGVALRFPRISRWRRDKTLKDIDTIDSVKQLIYAL